MYYFKTSLQTSGCLLIFKSQTLPTLKAVQQDQTLIEDLKGSAGKRQSAEGRLYQQYRYFIDEGCRKYDLAEQDSFTAYSDAVLSLIQNVRQEKFDGRSSLKTYLYQIFSNKCVDIVRHNTTNKQQANRGIAVNEDLLLQLPDGTRSIIENLITRQQADVMQQQLSAMGDKCREILLMYEEGLTDRQIAEEMAYQNAAVVKTTRLRCLDKLREKVLSLMQRN